MTQETEEGEKQLNTFWPEMEINWNYAKKQLRKIVPDGKSSSPDVRNGQDELSVSLSKSTLCAVSNHETNYMK